MPVRILVLGEIVGKAGVYCIKAGLPKLREELGVEFVIANGDGATGGFGIGKNHSIYLRKLGLDVITGGDQIYYKKDMVPHIDGAYYMLRPANYPPGTPGRGWRYYTVGGKDAGDSAPRIAVISMLGQSGYDRVHASNPYTYLPELAGRAKAETPFVVVDFHATTTAEKNTMFHHIDGKVSAVVGTGTRVQTADARIMPEKTAVITDAGRVGSQASVSGFDPEPEIRAFLTAVPERSQESWAALELQGVLIDLADDGTATSIEAIRHVVERDEQEQS
jgi:metallophosphoesterase (TIGR00282 family)